MDLFRGEEVAVDISVSITFGPRTLYGLHVHCSIKRNHGFLSPMKIARIAGENSIMISRGLVGER